MDLEQAFQLIGERPTNSARPASKEEITEAEATLGVQLPLDYRSFLQVLGSTYWPEAVYGVDPGLPPGENLVQVTLDERTAVEPTLPPSLIPFSPDGWGNHYCLDTENLESGVCPVVFWSHELEADQVPERTHDSFGAWLVDMVESAL